MNLAEMREIIWPEYDKIPDEELELQLIQMTKLASALVDFQINKWDINVIENESEL